MYIYLFKHALMIRGHSRDDVIFFVLFWNISCHDLHHAMIRK